MKSSDGKTTPSWYDAATPPIHYPPPAGESRADVCVVGAGIAGLTTAYLLAKAGKKVIVLDEGPVGSGQTGRTSAHLASAIDDRFVEIEKWHGLEGAKTAYESHARAIDAIEEISRTEKIECSFRRLDGYLFPVPDESPNLLDDELAAARRAGFADVEKIERLSLRGFTFHGPALRFGRQARFHPLQYLFGLAAAFERLGGKIYTGCRVKAVEGADPAKGKPAKAMIDDGPQAVLADAIVVATNTPSPINDWMGIYLKQTSYRTYMVAMSLPPTDGSTDALYWDTGDPYHYVRVDPREGLLLVGGEDHRVGESAEEPAPFLRLQTWARQMFPRAEETKARWSGQVQEPADGLGFIGRAPTSTGENVFAVTGDSGMGLTHGTIAGLLITDLILGKPNPWEKLYDPSRRTINRELIEENTHTVAKYAELVTGGDVANVEEIRPGEGGVVREGLSKVAVYRDDSGGVHKCSAICTHLKCVVHWNTVEKSWDCPCHGSRFDPMGRVLMGPAVDDLKALND